jgi:hypothetical protein
LVSKPIAIVVALFIATIISAVIGYSYYHSYRAVLASLETPPSLESVLSRVSSFKYRISYYNGSSWIVLVNNDNAHRRLNITFMEGNGTVIAYYLIGYSGDQIIYAVKVDPHTGNRTSLDIAKIDAPLRTSVEVITTPTGEVGVEPFPGIGPLYALYTITKSLSIDWLNPSSSSVRVGWSPTQYKLGEKTLRAVRVEAIPRTAVAPSTPYGALDRVLAVVAVDKGLVIFPSLRYDAGETSMSITMSSIHILP